ncbi:SpoIIE family protein phosphatase [Streptomyces sp. NPDC003691]
MRPHRAGAHPGCVTSNGAPGDTPPQRHGATPAEPKGGGAVPDELELLLTEVSVGATEAVGGFAGGVYLPSGTTEGLLRLSVMAGLPLRLFRPWWRVHENRPFPVSYAHRSGRAVYLPDAEEAMRRFPQLMVSLPFPFSALYVPVLRGTQRFGVLGVLRSPTPGRPVAQGDRQRMQRAADRLGEALGALHDDGLPIVWDAEPVPVQLPSLTAPPVRVGHFDWDLDTGALTGDEAFRRILGRSSGDRPGRAEDLTGRLAPEDAAGLLAVARRTAVAGRSSARRIRLRGADGRAHLVELSGGPPRRPGAAEGPSVLHGSLVDLGAGPVVTEAVDRLPRAVLTLDRLGRITHLNHTAELLLGRGRPELIGRVLWEALPWLADPAYEDHLRAALMAPTPVSFIARRGEGERLEVGLYSGHDGVTVTLLPAEHPVGGRRARPAGAPPPGGPFAALSGQSAAIYRPVALAIALTEAVTARQVSAVVTDELLPAFGGRALAIYLLHERHLFLAWETGFPQGFLDRFDGVGLDARLPGVETLTTGRPLFFESMEQLATAYPGIPLDAHVGARAFLPLIASGRPVGSCILGFDQPRTFGAEERTVLVALAGLIAQALERARRYDTESALARGLQDALLPHRLPVLDQVETVGRYLPGTQGMDVGGDWYDVIETDGLIALVIGDVQGHGVAAAATMGQLRSALRAFALSGHGPPEVMGRTNRMLIDLDPGQFASCVYLVLDPATGRARAVRAGHPQPLLRHPDGRTEVLDLAGGVVLGVDPAATYPVTELLLEPGSVLALYTDGLVERAGADIDTGVERLRASLAGREAEPLPETANRLIREARQAEDRPDDIALLLATRWE